MSKMPHSIKQLLPWYANNSLAHRDRQLVEKYLLRNPALKSEVELSREVYRIIKDSPLPPPSSDVYPKVINMVGSREIKPVKTRYHTIALGLAVIIMGLLWIIIRPGIVLEWSIHTDHVREFRVYRSIEGVDKNELIDSLPVLPDSDKYYYIDALLLPWNSYTYTVEGVEFDDHQAIRASVTRSALDILPGQVALIAFSLFLGYCIASVINLHFSSILMANHFGRFAL